MATPLQGRFGDRIFTPNNSDYAFPGRFPSEEEKERRRIKRLQDEIDYERNRINSQINARRGGNILSPERVEELLSNSEKRVDELEREIRGVPLVVEEEVPASPLFPNMPGYTPAGYDDLGQPSVVEDGLLGSEGLGGYSQLPGSGAPASVVTASPEMIKVDGEYQPSSRQDVITGSLGNLMEGMPAVSGRGFKTEGKIQEEADEKARARIWGNYSYDPAEAQSRYEDYMKDIYSKSMMLNAIAALTGGKSRASNFVEMATKRMEMEESFRDQTRLQSIQRGIYYTEDGIYDPPKNQQEAFDRAMKFGASADLASKVSGYAPKDDDRAWNNWYNLETGQVEQYQTGDKPEGDGWVKGTPSQSSDRKGNVRERLSQDVTEFALTGRLQDALDRYKNHVRAGDAYTNEGLLDKQAIAYVFGAIPSNYKITLDKIPSPEEEASIKASNPNLVYYLAEGQIGIFN
jgi:hypothetical protein